MSAPHIILDRLPSLCQKLSDLVEVWRSYNKNNFACFLLRHGAQYKDNSRPTIIDNVDLNVTAEVGGLWTWRHVVWRSEVIVKQRQWVVMWRRLHRVSCQPVTQLYQIIITFTNICLTLAPGNINQPWTNLLEQPVNFIVNNPCCNSRHFRPVLVSSLQTRGSVITDELYHTCITASCYPV